MNLDTIRENKEDIYKKVSHFLLFWVSLLFTCMLFLSFTDHYIWKWVWLALAVSLELLKNYLIKKIKTEYKSCGGWILMSLLISYLVIAIISGICTFGSVKLTLQSQEMSVERANVSSENIEFSITQIDKKIERLGRSVNSSLSENEKMNELEDAYYSGMIKLSADMKIAEKEIESLLEKRTILVNSLKEENANIQTVSKDVFTLIGESVGLTGMQTLFWIFMILIVVLELALFLTTSTFHTVDVAEEHEVDVILRYVDALEKANGSVILNSDDNISENTSISRKDCRRYRELLKEIVHRGKPLISDNNRTNWNVSTTKKAVKEYFEKESI